MQKSLCIAAGTGLIFFQLGCSGSKVGLLERQIAQLQAQNDSLRAEVETTRGDFTQIQSANRSLQQELQTKEETIAQQESALNDLQFQNLELKANLNGAGRKSPQKVALSGDFKEDYERAIGLFEKKWYQQAAAVFKALAESDRTNPLADNCQYWLGECYFAQKQYENALAEFEKVLTFPQSNKSDAALLKIGLCWLQMKKYAEAKEQLVRLLSTYPSSEYVPRARALLEEIP